MKRAIFIIPASEAPAVNDALEAEGLGPNNFSVAMEDSRGVITHYACSIAPTNAYMEVMRSHATRNTVESDDIKKSLTTHGIKIKNMIPQEVRKNFVGKTVSSAFNSVKSFFGFGS